MDLTGCPIEQLPAGLTVNGGVLRIAGTKITKLPIDLKIEEMEWSEPLQVDEIKKQFYRMRLSDMKLHFYNNADLYHSEKDATGQPIMVKVTDEKTGRTKTVPKPKLDVDGNKILLSDAEKEEAWIKFQPELIGYFLNRPNMEKSARAILKYVSPSSIKNRGSV